jgi:hypothetical protein
MLHSMTICECIFIFHDNLDNVAKVNNLKKKKEICSLLNWFLLE